MASLYNYRYPTPYFYHSRPNDIRTAMSIMASENNFLIKEYNEFMLNVGSDESTPKFGLNIF